MKITFLNGVPDESHPGFDRYLTDLQAVLEEKEHPTQLLRLRDLDARYCSGC